MPKALAVGIVGAYSGSIYLSTIIGGWLADRVIGPKNTLFFAVPKARPGSGWKEIPGRFDQLAC